MSFKLYKPQLNGRPRVSKEAPRTRLLIAPLPTKVALLKGPTRREVSSFQWSEETLSTRLGVCLLGHIFNMIKIVGLMFDSSHSS